MVWTRNPIRRLKTAGLKPQWLPPRRLEPRHLQSGRLQPAGFSLVELVLVISIATILTLIGVPTYRYVTTSNRTNAEINGLLGDIEYARYEAIKEGLPVTICPAQSATGSTCNVTTNWSAGGWIVLSNPAINNGTSVVLRRQLPFSSLNSLNSSDTLSSAGANSTPVTSLTFNREGFLSQAAGSALFAVHDPSSNSSFTRCLAVNAAGSLTTTTYGNTVYTMLCS